MMALLHDVSIICVSLAVACIIWHSFNTSFFPWLVNKKTKDLNKNPKWLVTKLQKDYYGFHDIDIIVVDSPFGMLPRFRLPKKSNRLQLLISEDVSTKDINEIGQLALAGKIRVLYGLWYPDKPLHWLSVLNYLLDGGEIKEAEFIRGTDVDKKTVDL